MFVVLIFSMKMDWKVQLRKGQTASFNRKRTRLGCVIAGNTDLERAVVFTAICIQVGIAVFAGVHLLYHQEDRRAEQGFPARGGIRF